MSKVSILKKTVTDKQLATFLKDIRVKKEEVKWDGTVDRYVYRILRNTPTCVVPWILIASYLYYHTDRVIISDACFDSLMNTKLKLFDESDKTHPHRKLITDEHLEIGSLFNVKKEDYPSIVKCSAEYLIIEVDLLRDMKPHLTII